MRDPDLVHRAERAATALEQAWLSWRERHSLGGGGRLSPVSSYVGYSVEEPWGQPRVVLGIDADGAERLAAILEDDARVGPVYAGIAVRPEGQQQADGLGQVTGWTALDGLPGIPAQPSRQASALPAPAEPRPAQPAATAPLPAQPVVTVPEPTPPPVPEPADQPVQATAGQPPAVPSAGEDSRASVSVVAVAQDKAADVPGSAVDQPAAEAPSEPAADDQLASARLLPVPKITRTRWQGDRRRAASDTAI